MLSAAIAASALGDNTVVAAVTGRRIRVLGFVLSPSATTVNAKFTDGAAGTNLAGLFYGTAGTVTVPCVPPVLGSQPGWFATTKGNALVLNLSAATAVGGLVLYDLVP